MDDLKKSSQELYDKLSKSSQDTYDRAISFLTSDYAKVLGKNAIITILSLILIGGASLAGARGIDKLQLSIDENIIQKSQLSRIVDLVFTARDGVEPTRSEKKQGVTMARAMILDILSKLGGKYSSEPTSGMGLKGKGFNDDFKQKFKEASKKVYDAITSDEAKSLGKNALVTIILATMGYGASKLIKGKQMGELQKTAQDIHHDIKIRDLELQSKLKESIQDAEFKKIAQAMIDKNQREKEKSMYEMASDIQAHKAHMKTKYPIEYGADSDSEEEYYEVQTTNPAIAQPTTVASGLKVSKLSTKDIKDYLHKVVTSKEAKVLGATALASLIMAGLGIIGYKAVKNMGTDIDFIKSQRNVAKLKAVLEVAKKKSEILPVSKSSEVIDILEDELEAQMRQSTNPESFEEEEEEQIHKINIPLSTLATNKTIAELEEMYKKIESDTMTKSIAKKMTDTLVDDVIIAEEEVKNPGESGKGLKKLTGRGFSEDAKKVKDQIYKIITSPKAKTIGATALSTLIVTALGGLGYNMIKTHEDKLRDIDENASSISRSKKFIKELESEWDLTPYKEGERGTHFTNGGSIKEDTQKGLKIASKKIADLIQYARELNLDKVALFSLITFLLGGVGYGGFKYIKGKARESEPIGYIPEDEVADAMREYATENIKKGNKKADYPWIKSLGFGLKKKIKGGDLSKFGEYAKKKEEAEKKAKPIAKQITDWIYSDEAKLIGKAGLQYAILTALGLLTAYAGKKAGEKVISGIPKDTSKMNDPNLFSDIIVEPSEEDIIAFEKRPKKATEAVLSSVFKGLSGDEILNLKRYALENPKNEAVKRILESHKSPHISDTILRSDPYLATIFHYKSPKKESSSVYKPEKYIENLSDYYKSKGASSQSKPKPPPKIPSDIDLAIQAQEQIEQNRPSLTVSPSSKAPTKYSVKDLTKMFSGTSKPTPESTKANTPTEKKSGETDNPILASMFAKGLKEDAHNFGKASLKKLNEVGNAIYKILTSQQVQGVAGGVTAGLIVSVLSMLMHEKRQEALAVRRANTTRSQRPRTPAPSRPAPPPPSRGDSEFNPFANQ
jgi:phosphate/sulfate permease